VIGTKRLEFKMASALSTFLSYLPQHEGLLPKWLLFVHPVFPSLK
jgi:hypothetical protein